MHSTDQLECAPSMSPTAGWPGLLAYEEAAPCSSTSLPKQRRQGEGRETGQDDRFPTKSLEQGRQGAMLIRRIFLVSACKPLQGQAFFSDQPSRSALPTHPFLPP